MLCYAAKDHLSLIVVVDLVLGFCGGPRQLLLHRVSSASGVLRGGVSIFIPFVASFLGPLVVGWQPN